MPVARATHHHRPGRQAVVGFHMPLGVALEAGMGLTFGKDPVKVYPVSHLQCDRLPGHRAVDDKMAAALKGATEAQLMFATLEGKPIAVPMSFKGYSTACAPWHSADAKRTVLVLETLVMTFSHSLIGAALGVLLASGAALAQDAPAAPDARRPGRPDVKAVGDWLVRCFPITSPSPCDMFQELDDQRTQQRVLSFSIAYVPSLDRHGIQITRAAGSFHPARPDHRDRATYKSPAMKYRYVRPQRLLRADADRECGDRRDRQVGRRTPRSASSPTAASL